MNNAFKIFSIFVLVVIFGASSVNACSVDFPSLREQFRYSKHVFVGELLEISDAPQNLQNSKERLVGGVVKFRIQKRWKGAKEAEISLLSDMINSGCGGQDKLSYFEKGKKYLIFARKDYVYFYEATEFDKAGEKIKRLDDSGFRAWARIYPF
ncbi:MAG TPA: hypothetical protein VF721_10655 [Pyrinomonadaceae bacterium]